jgi:hypothetical protein
MKTETTISHACKALNLIIDGAVRHIENDYGPDDPSDRTQFVITLFDELRRTLLDWGVSGSIVVAEQDLRDDMETLLDPTKNAAELMQHFSGVEPEKIKMVMAVLLSRHDLLP